MLDTPNPLSHMQELRGSRISKKERRWNLNSAEPKRGALKLGFRPTTGLVKGWALRDSNPQPTAYEAAALTDCAKGPENIEE